MGALVSSRKESSLDLGPGHVFRVAGKPPVKEERQCSSAASCKIEDVEINSLTKMQSMDKANTDTKDLTAENFNQVWKKFEEEYAYLLSAASFPEFIDEREKVANAFSGDSAEEKEAAIAKYNESVDAVIAAINAKVAKEIEKQKAKAENEAACKPPDPKKK